VSATAGRNGMPPWHIGLAVLVVGIWGTNFVVIHVGLTHFGPFTFATLRFLFASLPLLLFVRRPKIAPGSLVTYGLAIGVGQTGLMLYALAGHISPGLASLLIQTQAFFTVALAVLLSGERVRSGNIAALVLCTAGILLIAVNMGGDVDTTGILLVLAAALSWGVGNIVAKRAGAIDMLALVAWSNLVAVPPLLAAALLFEGPAAIQSSVLQADAAGWGTVLWQAFGNALFGYAAWNWLLARHPAAEVAPMGLLVPIFGMSAAAWLLAEPMPLWKLAAAALVLTGLAVNLTTGRRAAQGAKPALHHP
jgi:O-acetylserine/cysteine efflux transporter